MTESKIWVVDLHCAHYHNPKRDTKYVRAKTQEGAIRVAKENSHLSGVLDANARLATPEDLGCVAA